LFSCLIYLSTNSSHSLQCNKELYAAYYCVIRSQSLKYSVYSPRFIEDKCLLTLSRKSSTGLYLHMRILRTTKLNFPYFQPLKLRKKIRDAIALTNLGRLSSRRWQSFPTAPDGAGLTCGQHIESHGCIFSFPNRTVTSLFKCIYILAEIPGVARD
jgi:hypothetical protein